MSDVKEKIKITDETRLYITVAPKSGDKPGEWGKAEFLMITKVKFITRFLDLHRNGVKRIRAELESGNVISLAYEGANCYGFGVNDFPELPADPEAA